jgi:hypothetical protein
MSRRTKWISVADLPPAWEAGRELLGLLDLQPVLPLYAEPTSTAASSGYTPEQIKALLQSVFQECAPHRTWISA